MDTKEGLRSYFLFRRNNLSAVERAKLSRLIAQRFHDWLRRKAVVSLGLYWPVQNEVDPFYILQGLKMTDIAYPRSNKEAKIVSFHHVESPGDLVRGSYGILEPPEGAPRIYPSVVLVPGVGFDRDCNRLGFGHGYYDRTIDAWPRESTTFVGLAYDFQVFPMIPAAPHDRPVDIVFTPEEEYFRSKVNI